MISFASSPWQIFLILPSQAKDLFEKICPDEEFLQAVPNPEDIILDDFLQDGNQNAEAEPEGEAQADAVVQESTEEESSSAGMVEEQDRVTSEGADGRGEEDAGVKDQSPASGASQEQREDDQESKQSRNEWSCQSFHWMTPLVISSDCASWFEGWWSEFIGKSLLILRTDPWSQGT